MKRILLLFGVLSLMAIQASAQRGGSPGDYKTAIGVRVNPWIIGFTAKHFIQGPHAIEGIVSHYFGSGDRDVTNVTLTGLYEYTWNVFGKSEWNMYAGGGAHVGFWRDRYYDNNGRKEYDTEANVGLDGIFGVEYTFKKIPLNLSGDIKPFFNFNGGHDFIGEQLLGVSARYTF
ncbi:hypothetical protein GFS24_10630 [Chitinophaga sp. SYP-B3965]|uniref:hypothetical protein n=1 Tax=Chitinophaga sp. SYP-B3965 TaxID=2663120 RepID=UPI0012995C53|nr:hypothetical protein [Chitinophaga sp. SYP-B3965]MRG45573.1 hypothetical protein [Chitinophaga sp. SYP-B3965]